MSSSAATSPIPPRAVLIQLSPSSISSDTCANLGSDIYLLHSTILRMCSPVFDASLSKRWWKHRNESGSNDPIKYRYILAQQSDGDWNLVPEHMVESTKTKNDPPTEVVAAFSNLFRAFYAQLDPQVEMLDPKACMDLAKLADMYCATQSIKYIIESIVVSKPQAIASEAMGYLRLGCLIQSPSIFRDAAIHLGGQAIRDKGILASIPMDAGRTHVYMAMSEMLRRSTEVNVKLLGIMNSLRLQEPLFPRGVIQPRIDIATTTCRRLFERISSLSNEIQPSAIMYRTLVSQMASTADIVRECGDGADDILICPLLKACMQDILQPILESKLTLGRGSDYEHLTCGDFTEPYPWESDNSARRSGIRRKHLSASK